MTNSKNNIQIDSIDTVEEAGEAIRTLVRKTQEMVAEAEKLKEEKDKETFWRGDLRDIEDEFESLVEHIRDEFPHLDEFKNRRDRIQLMKLSSRKKNAIYYFDDSIAKERVEVIENADQYFDDNYYQGDRTEQYPVDKVRSL